MSRVLDMSFPFALTDVNRPQTAIVKSLAKNSLPIRRLSTAPSDRHATSLSSNAPRAGQGQDTAASAERRGRGGAPHPCGGPRAIAHGGDRLDVDAKGEASPNPVRASRRGIQSITLRPRFRVKSVPAQINAKRLVVSLIDEIRLAGLLVAQGREQPREALPIVSEVHNRSIT
jgi:hypothetical protein